MWTYKYFILDFPRSMKKEMQYIYVALFGSYEEGLQMCKYIEPTAYFLVILKSVRPICSVRSKEM